MTIKTSVKEIIGYAKEIGGAADRSNEAYLMYEKSSGKSIIRRDESDKPIVSPNGYFYLKEGESFQDNDIDAFRHAYWSAKQARDNSILVSHFLGDLNEAGEFLCNREYEGQSEL